MHSDPVEKSGSPRKRIVSRAMSEEESLRHVIEAEESPKRFPRRDSRYGSLRRRDTRGSQSEDEPPDVTSMPQQDYEARLAELRQEVLLFQLDCLRDALEGAEETLAETRREARQFSMELEREREQRRRLESAVAPLMQEVERLKAEQLLAERPLQERKGASVMADPPAAPAAAAADDAGGGDAGGGDGDDGDDDDDDDDVDGCVSNDPKPGDKSSGSTSSFATFAAATYLLFKNSRFRPSPSNQPRPEGTSVDQEVPGADADDAEDHDESSGYEDAPSDFSPSTPDGCSDAGLPEDRESEPRNRSATHPDNCVLS